MSTPAFLHLQRLIVVTGKGGVGKSAVSAALALAFARAGQRTLVCEVNTEERITQLLGRPPVGAEVRQIEQNLWAVDARPFESMKEYALMTLRFERLYKVVFENRFVRYFLRFVPSLQELVMLGKILYHLKEKDAQGRFRFDRVVLDAPATGHAISFLSVPQVLLDTVPPGPLATDATWMRDLLVNPDVTGAVLVSLPEDMPVNETLDLARALREDVHVGVRAVVLNAAIGPRFNEEDLAALGPQAKDTLGPRIRAHQARSRMTEEATQRLSTLGVPVVAAPRVHGTAFNRQALEHIAEALRPLWGGT